MRCHAFELGGVLRRFARFEAVHQEFGHDIVEAGRSFETAAISPRQIVPARVDQVIGQGFAAQPVEFVEKHLHHLVGGCVLRLRTGDQKGVVRSRRKAAIGAVADRALGPHFFEQPSAGPTAEHRIGEFERDVVLTRTGRRTHSGIDCCLTRFGQIDHDRADERGIARRIRDGGRNRSGGGPVAQQSIG